MSVFCFFDGLAIAEETALCEAYMGKFLVIFVSLKGVDGLTFEDARRRLQSLLQAEAGRHDELRNEGREDILAYGIAFCRKRCKVVCERL